MKRFFVRTTTLILLALFLFNSSVMAATVRVYGGVHSGRHMQPVNRVKTVRYTQPSVNYVYARQPVNYTYITPINYYEPMYVQTVQTTTYASAPVYQHVPTTTVNEYYVNNNSGSGILGPLLGAAALTVGIVALTKR